MQPGRNKTTMKWLATAILAAIVIILCIAYWFNRHKPSRDFERLLDGNKVVALASVRIYGQGKEIVLDDAISVEYLTEAFLASSREPPALGTTYTADIRFDSGGLIKAGFYVPVEQNWLVISFPLDRFDDPIYYWVQLPQPIPETVSSALHQLRWTEIGP